MSHESKEFADQLAQSNGLLFQFLKTEIELGLTFAVIEERYRGQGNPDRHEINKHNANGALEVVDRFKGRLSAESLAEIEANRSESEPLISALGLIGGKLTAKSPILWEYRLFAVLHSAELRLLIANRLNEMHDGQPSDEYQLVQRTCAGDREAARILFCELLGPLAEALGHRWNYPDLPNQLFVHLCENDWRRLRTWKGPGCVKGWARAVCRNLFLAEVKARSGMMPLSE